MSGLVAPKTAELTLLKYIVGKITNVPSGATSGQILHLYSNNYSPDSNAIYPASFTEVSIAGYTAQTLTYTNWTWTTDSSGYATAYYGSEITFSFTAGGSIYGYYVTDNSQLLWCEQFAGAPFTMPSPSGGTIAVQPQLQLS